MSDQVTISTFLELRDNMSEGLRRLADALEGVTKGTAPATAAVNKMAQQAEEASKRIRRAKTDEEKTAERSAKERERIEARAARYMRLAAERSARERVRLEAQATKAMEMAAERRARIAHAAAVREANAAIREAERATRARERLERRSANTAVRESLRVQRAYGNMSTHVINSSSAMRTALNTAMGAVTAVFGYRAIKGVVELDRDFENLQHRIAGTLRAFRLAPSFGQAELQGKKVLDVLRKLAIPLPGEAEDYAEAFTTALPKIIASGMTDLTQAADFVSRYTAVAIDNSVDAAQAGRDLMLMLSGRAGLQVKTFVALSERIGMTAKNFNELNKSARLEKIQKAIQPWSEELSRGADKFDAKMGAVKSQFKDILKLGSEPLFRGLKTILSEIEVYLTKNKRTLIESAQVIARDLVDGFNKVKEFLFQLPDKLNDIWETSKLIAGVWAGTALFNGVANLVRSFKELRTLLLSIQGMTLFTGAAGAAGTAGAAGVAGASGRIAAGAAGFAGAAGLMALLFPSAAGGDKELAFEAAQKDRQRLSDEINKKYEDVVKMLGVAGQSYAYDTTTITGALSEEMFASQDLQERLTELYRKMSVGVGVRAPEAAAYMRKMQERILDYAAAIGYEIPTGMSPDLGPESLAAKSAQAKKAPSDRARNNTYFYNNKFDIKQEFAEGFDPDRIAVAFSNDLGRLGEMKLQSVYGHVGMVR